MAVAITPVVITPNSSLLLPFLLLGVLMVGVPDLVALSEVMVESDREGSLERSVKVLR